MGADENMMGKENVSKLAKDYKYKSISILVNDIDLDHIIDCCKGNIEYRWYAN